ncbi:hypothetical protein Ancab_040647 [Ancistrocladus abbreviatus]
MTNTPKHERERDRESAMDMAMKLLLTQNTEGERKEIQHPWHPDHPLFEDVKVASESDSDIACALCHSHISGRVFGCKECEFYLHDVCAELPPELQHPAHPTHPLKLRPFVGEFRIPRCRLCSRGFYTRKLNDKGLVYACDNTDNMCFEDGMFVMHVECALLKPPSKKHPSHEHPLVFIKEYGCLANCAACGSKIQHSKDDGADIYRCLECNIRIHQGCVDAPTTSELQAAQQWRPAEIFYPFSPSTPLLEITVNEADISCDLCRSLVSGPAYGSREAGLFLDQHCAKTPEYFLHPLHGDLLFIEAYYRRQKFVCNLCHLTHVGGDFRFYKSSTDANFKMHVDCAAMKSTWQHPNHKHPFVLIKKGRPLNFCSACGAGICSDSSDSPTSYYFCWTCNIYFHEECLDLPFEIERFDVHPHILKLNFDPLPADYDDNIDYFCDACNEERAIHAYS